MSQPTVTIERGMPEHLRAQAASVFDQAFGAKLSMAIPSAQKRGAIIKRGLVAEHLVVAMVGDELAGLVGLNSQVGAYAGGVMTDDSLNLRSVVNELGYLGALRAAFVLMLADHKPGPDELYIDGIAVAAVARGRGIGTRLLDEVETIAREGGFGRIRLEVVDANPRAQELYARQGYVVVGTSRFGFLRRFIGFGGTYTMDLPIEADADEVATAGSG